MGVFSAVGRCSGLLLAACILAGVWGCSSSDEPQTTSEKAESPYSDWLTYTHDNVVMHYPQDHPYADEIPNLAQGYPTAVATDARLLQIPPPRGSLHVYVYTGPGQAFEVTGERYPFVDENRIHYWRPYYLGETVMEYVLSRWTDIEPRFRFLRAGLITLMNHSRKNYHEIVKGLMDKGDRLPLDSLAADTAITYQKWVLRSQQSASFVDFLIYMYGLPALKGLWAATSNWEEAVKGLLKVTPEELDREWVEFVEQVTAGERPEPKSMPWRETPPDTANQ